MRIVVLGAGAMGSLFGGRLHQAGHEVALVDVRPERIAAINAAGLRLATDAGEAVLSVQAARAADLTDVADLVILFTKAMDSDAALASARHLLGPQTVVLTVQNGLGNDERVARHVPRERVVAGMTNWPADLGADGVVRSHGAGVTRVMAADGVCSERLERVAAALDEAGLACAVDPEVGRAIWEKAAFNAALNALAAVSGGTVGAIGDSPDGRALARAVVWECIAVGRAKGLALDESRVWAAVEAAFRDHRGHQPSMLQDVQAGRATEIDTLNGAIAREAEGLGVAAPVTAALGRLVRLVEDVRGVPRRSSTEPADLTAACLPSRGCP